MKNFLYIFVRKDLSKAQQVVQSMHAAFESGLKHDQKLDHPSVVLLELKDKDDAKMAYNIFKEMDFNINPFFEPYYNNELTSFAIQNIKEEEKFLFKKFKLLRY